MVNIDVSKSTFFSLRNLLFVHGQLIGLELEGLSVIVAGEAPHDVSRRGLLRISGASPSTASHKIWGWVKTLVPSEPQNSW